MINIALCDNNADDLSSLVSLLNEYTPCINASFRYTCFSNGLDLISALEKGEVFDIYCLDIMMPQFDGMQLSKEILGFNKNTVLIFVSSSPDFALESFSVKAFDYILKPMERGRFFRTLDQAFVQILSHQDYVVVKSNDGIKKLCVSDLLFLEAQGVKTVYHTVDRQAIVCNQKFRSACDSLEVYPCFLKPHRSYLVNMRYIDTIGDSKIILQSSDKVPISHGNIKSIKHTYLEFQMKEVTAK